MNIHYCLDRTTLLHKIVLAPRPARLPLNKYVMPNINFDSNPQSIPSLVQFLFLPWHERTIKKIEAFESILDERIPYFTIQKKLDEVGTYIQKRFALLHCFNEWLDDNGSGEWYKQLAVFLYKLPMRAVRNIINLLYKLIYSLIYTAVHPLKSLTHITKLLITLINALTKPETWAHLGAGIIGASLGQGLVSGNPLSTIALGIGGALFLGGLTTGIIKEALKTDATVGKYLLKQGRDLSETMLTGFCMGLLIGGIQRVFQSPYVVKDLKEAKNYANHFIKKHNLPNYRSVEVDGSGKITLTWHSKDLASQPDLLKPFTWENMSNRYHYFERPTQLQVVISPKNSHGIVTIQEWDTYESTYRFRKINLEQLGIRDHTYPTAVSKNLALEPFVGAIAANQ